MKRARRRCLQTDPLLPFAPLELISPRRNRLDLPEESLMCGACIIHLLPAEIKAIKAALPLPCQVTSDPPGPGPTWAWTHLDPEEPHDRRSSGFCERNKHFSHTVEVDHFPCLAALLIPCTSSRARHLNIWILRPSSTKPHKAVLGVVTIVNAH